jgi:hypothetical protein
MLPVRSVQTRIEYRVEPLILADSGRRTTQPVTAINGPGALSQRRATGDAKMSDDLKNRGAQDAPASA